MGYSAVTKDEYKVSELEVTHLPTGARFWRYPGLSEIHGANWGEAGAVMPNSKEYDRDEVLSMAQVVLDEHNARINGS